MPASPSKYDAWNRLVDMSESATYEYDGLGRRIQRVVPDLPYFGTYDFYYNEEWQLLEERKSGSANPLGQYVWHPYYIDALAVRYYDASTSGSQVQHFYCHDANYNVTAVVNASGTVLERYNYTPYGTPTFLDANFAADADQISDIGNQHLYTGRERDPETGLQLNRHRYYASHLGRWLTRDPIGYEGNTRNLYEYTNSTPLTDTDPLGFRKCTPVRAIHLTPPTPRYGICGRNTIPQNWPRI